MIRILTLAILTTAVLMGSFQSANAVPIVYTASLGGGNESPPNASPGIGFAEVDFDIVAHSMRVLVTFSGLLGTTTASHIHCPTAVAGTGTAGVATQTPTFTGWPVSISPSHIFTYSQRPLQITIYSNVTPSSPVAMKRSGMAVRVQRLDTM